jgi:hypothetical protein
MSKRQYNKPEIFYEDFSLSTNIAAGCEIFPNAPNGGVQWGAEIIFTEAISGCIKKVGASTNYNGLCYHNPTGINVFDS